MPALKSILSGLESSHLVTFQGFLVHKQIVRDFDKMKQAAALEGIALTIVSAYRDFSRQQLIWNNKFNGIRPVFNDCDVAVDIAVLSDYEKCQAILRFSMLPGASRHHLGTDLDVFDKASVPSDYEIALSQAEYTGEGPFAKLANWLTLNCHKFGFYLPYQYDLGGVAKEPWHISHIATATDLLSTMSCELLCELIEQSEVAGKPTLLAHLPEIYTRFVVNTTSPFADNG
jgi:LAS superfamily LD-carboxypeptidase LdcB